MDVFSPEKRSWIMAQVKSSGGKSTEERFRRIMRANGVTGWRRNYPLFGTPDFVFPKERVAVFVDGCFWHGHPRGGGVPETNREFWERKIQRNIKRDREVNRTLRKKGWKVLRIWEHKVSDPSSMRRLRKALSINDE